MEAETKKERRKRIFVVDDHPIVRRGFAMLINQENDLTVCGEAEDVQPAIESILDQKPDMVILDISLKSGSGIDLVKSLKDCMPDLPMLVVSMHDEFLYGERAIRAGAKGYLMKQEANEVVVGAIRHVLNGGVYLSEKIKEKMLLAMSNRGRQDQESPIERLSDRELEVFRLLGMGRGTRQIADEINVSIKTVESYRARIKEKMAIDNATELLQHAVLWVQREQSQ